MHAGGHDHWNVGERPSWGWLSCWGLAAGVVGTIWLQGGWGRDMVQIRTASSSVGQLVAGAAVKFRGVSVGHVDAVNVAPNGEAVIVDMSVRPELVLPPNAAVLLAPESVFGDWQAGDPEPQRDRSALLRGLRRRGCAAGRRPARLLPANGDRRPDCPEPHGHLGEIRDRLHGGDGRKTSRTPSTTLGP